MWSRIGARASDPGCPLRRGSEPACMSDRLRSLSERSETKRRSDLPVVERADRDETPFAILSCGVVLSYGRFDSAAARPRSTVTFACQRRCAAVTRLTSTLALLVARVGLADHHHAPVAADDLAVVADGLDGGVDLHDFLFRCLHRAGTEPGVLLLGRSSGSGRRCARG